MKAILSSFSIILILLMSINSSWSQTGNTVGLIRNNSESYNGYTLLSPVNSQNTYLIDNCGEVVNSWTSNYNPAMTSHLTKDGHLLRSGRISSTFNEGGSGGLAQLFDWNGELIWQYKLSENFVYHQHHDIKYMPNGNILVLAWEYNSPSDAIDFGVYPDLITDEGVWTELLLEIVPLGSDDSVIAWEWHMNDHLIQDYDQSKSNYGKVSDHPELIDINYQGSIDPVDRFHANALDYNEDLDQIVINSRNYHEFYVIDHSTTTEEAAGHDGGNSNMGGDVMYRYGNPVVYDRGSVNDQKFYSQHGANWVKQGQYKNGIIVFNNGINRPQGSFSSVEIVMPIRNGYHYEIDSIQAFGPEAFDFAYVGTPTSSFFSPRLSNAVVLPNENILITEGQTGKLFEITQEKEIVWEYINPVLGLNIATQGDNSPLSDVFASERYSMDYSGLVGDLTATRPIEFNSFYNCEIEEEVVTTSSDQLNQVNLLQNPIDEEINLANTDAQTLLIQMYDVYGRIVSSFRSSDVLIRKQLNIPKGYYFMRITNEADQKVKTIKIVKG